MSQPTTDTKLLKLRDAGMFSNINEFLDNVIRAEREDYIFAVDWSKSPYKDSSVDIDEPWEYYFENPYGVTKSDVDEEVPSIIGTEHEVVAPHVEVDAPVEVDGPIQDPYRMGLLLPPKDRERGHSAIRSRLNIKENIIREIDAFVEAEFEGNVIGVHLRGPHGDHGGSGYYRQLYPTEQFVPFDLIFRYVDSRLDQTTSGSLYIASDSQFVINRFMERYDDVITYSANRIESGEMHQSYPGVRDILRNVKGLFGGDYGIRDLSKGTNRILDLAQLNDVSDYKLGKDVLIEAVLLSRTDHLIHGCSNVTNFALCNNPDLTSDFIFKDDLKRVYGDFYDWEVGDDIEVDNNRNSG